MIMKTLISSYNEEHELFVSNSKGSSVMCVLICLFHAPTLMLLLKLIQHNRKPRFLRDFIFFVFPLLLNITILVDQSYVSCCFLLLTEIYVLYNNRKTGMNINIITTENENIKNSIDLPDNNNNNHKSYLSLFRGINMLLTCLSILAVDFRIFPRRFAKTETFGISLMDVGIGGFIISSALTSKFARGKVNVPNKFISFSIKNIIVLILGFGRMAAIRLFNYHSKASEYGTSWNFFVTLFLVWTISDIFKSLFPRRILPLVAIIILCIYQFLLSYTNLQYFVFSASRERFFSSNREGILSLLAFVPLYLLVESYSYYVIWESGVGNTSNANISLENIENNSNISSDEQIKNYNRDENIIIFGNSIPNNIIKICKNLSYTSICLWILWIISSSHIQPTSRRLSNITYVLLILAMSSIILLVTIIADYIGGVNTRIIVLESIANSQLEIFILCNLITGIVNMSINTIYMDKATSLTILSLYGLFITSIAYLFKYWRFRKNR